MIGDRIRLIRESYRLSQVEFGKILNVSKQTVSNWENNNVQPSVDIIRDISLKFNSSSDFILELDDRLTIYFDKHLPIEMITHIQNILNDLLLLNSKLEEKHGNTDSDMWWW